MKKILPYIFLLFACLPLQAETAQYDGATSLDPDALYSGELFDEADYSGMMGSWTLHFAFQQVKMIAVSSTHAYGLSEGALFAVDREDESLRYLNQLSGLSDANISGIYYDKTTSLLLVFYANGNIDLLSEEGDVYNISDLYMKQMSGVSKQANAVCFHQDYAYLAMPFGVMQLNMRKHEIADTYYLGAEGKNVDIVAVGIQGDSIYALAADSLLYRARLRDNLVDYNVWRAVPFELLDAVTAEAITQVLEPAPSDRIESSGDTFIAGGVNGIEKIAADGTYTKYVPNGPAVNLPYSMTYSNGRIFVVPGGRWAVEYDRPGNVMIYEEGKWSNLLYRDIQAASHARATDFVSVAVDPKNKKHFSVMSYGTGVYEFDNDGLVAHRSYYNSPNGPTSAAPNVPDRYTRCEGAVYDNEGNLWLMNAGQVTKNVCIMNPAGNWISFNFVSNGTRISYVTPAQIVIDSRHPNWKWMPSCRETVGLGLLDDNGTPFDTADDRMIFHSSFQDQNGNLLTPEAIYCISQDRKGTIWLGTSEGIITIPANVDFFRSNQCQRLLINRTDGSGLADWLLDKEPIKAIVHDGGNRHWIGTAGSGVFLVTYTDADVNATIYHFTSQNSPLPSNNIFSIAILAETGEVFIGTETGLASFRSDASEPKEDFSSAYVYPNPVRPNYDGNITFTGLAESTYVKVVNAGGEVVFYTRSNGGTAVWNGKDQNGNSVPAGVYRAYCNSDDGQHRILKLLIM